MLERAILSQTTLDNLQCLVPSLRKLIALPVAPAYCVIEAAEIAGTSANCTQLTCSGYSIACLRLWHGHARSETGLSVQVWSAFPLQW